MPAYGKMTQKERIAEAKKLLEEAGYNKSNPLKFTLLYNTSETTRRLQLRSNLCGKLLWALISHWKTKSGKPT